MRAKICAAILLCHAQKAISKALRLFQHAERFGFPVLSFINTPGADPGIQSEERGQGNAIAENILGHGGAACAYYRRGDWRGR